MDNKLILKIRKPEKKSQRSISFTESRIKHLDSLTKILNYQSNSDIVNSIIDEYFANGFIYDEETNTHIPMKVVLEAIKNDVVDLEGLRNHIENKGGTEDNE